MDCQHKTLQKCEMGPLFFYRCAACHDNFIATPDVIGIKQVRATIDYSRKEDFAHIPK